MTDRLESIYRLASAAFLDDPSSQAFSTDLGDDLPAALQLLVKVFSRDLGLPPKSLDGESLGQLLGVLLPGRVAGNEPFLGALPDLLEAYLVFLAEHEGLAMTWEWTHAVTTHRERFVEALRDPARQRPAAPVRHTPDRRPGAKLNRNAPCFCGSGRKYKHCCARLLD